jgi:hypothetical protein
MPGKESNVPRERFIEVGNDCTQRLERLERAIPRRSCGDNRVGITAKYGEQFRKYTPADQFIERRS